MKLKYALTYGCETYKYHSFIIGPKYSTRFHRLKKKNIVKLPNSDIGKLVNVQRKKHQLLLRGVQKRAFKL
jgi:hypothetical protein